MPEKHRVFVAILLALAAGPIGFPESIARAEPARTEYKLSFGPGQLLPGYTRVLPDMIYSKDLGYGFEKGAKITTIDAGAGCCTSAAPFFFSVAAPEGNYRVTVTLGHAQDQSTTTVKAELRRLMLE